MPHIDDAAARDAVLSYASQHLCWGISAARDMTILDITPSSAFRVTNKLIYSVLCRNQIRFSPV